MALYRVTIRFGAPKQQYHIEDVPANSLREAMRLAAERFPDAAFESADLAEIRRQVEPEERSFTPV
jgi:predicted Zn-dependent peptidase